MSAANSLTDEQIAEIQGWADDGAALADIQKRLGEEMSVRVTYMEMRFLIEDIGVTLKPDEPKKKEPEPEADPEPEVEGDAAESNEPENFSDIPDSDEGDQEEGGDDSPPTAEITVDEVQRPNMIVSGKVTFNGGKVLSWYLDQLGRLGVDPGPDEEFRPSEDQLRVFQANLQVVLSEKGYG